MAKKLTKNKRKFLIALVQAQIKWVSVKERAILEAQWLAFEERQNRAFMACYCW